MAEDLIDGEFWLPSQFLDDDDDDDDNILTDFTSGSSDDESAFSPQSTLLGCQPGSSVGSPTEVVHERKEEDDNDNNNNNNNNNRAATLELLNKAAGEVAKMKMLKSDNIIRTATTTSSNGTGFFDCSRTSSKTAKGILCPPPLSLSPMTTTTTPYFPPHFYSHPHFRHFTPHMMWGPAQLPPQPQQRNRAITNNNKSNVDGRPLGLPQSAWPTLPGQAQAQAQAQPQAKPMLNAFVGPQRDSVGTGVFLPRRVTTPTDPKKKSDGNVMKTKNNKGSQRRSARPTKAFDDEIKLPSEWVY